MYKTLFADRDAYITDKVIKSVRKTSSNVGIAATLDLFKLYGATTSGSSPNTELSRLLVHFDLDPLRELVSQGRIDLNDSSFWCKMTLKDVYGGQPTPRNFTVNVYPLSASFDEGLGKDVVYYSDRDACNWLSSSYGTAWTVAGCSSSSGDYLTSSVGIPDTKVSQVFSSGEEDLQVDMTALVSATLVGHLPDSGFRISFDNSLEVNTQTYFVKRFGSRHVYDESKRPRLNFGFDDSVTDDSQSLTFDADLQLNLYNYAASQPKNLVSSSVFMTGSNCVKLKLSTEVSGGMYDLIFSGSQLSHGSNFVTGVYAAIVNIPSTDTVVATKILQSGSVLFTPIWSSNDLTVSFTTGSVMTFSPPDRSSSSNQLKNFVVGVTGLKSTYTVGDEEVVRVFVFDHSSPLIRVVKVPVDLPGIVVKDVFYSVRDAVTNEVVVPFDDVTNSTKVSSDANGMFFSLDTSNLTVGKTYVIDIMVSNNGTKKKFSDASANFRVDR